MQTKSHKLLMNLGDFFINTAVGVNSETTHI